jgi:hypothetical protein
MLKFNPTTPVRYYVKKSKYIPGKGQESRWEDLGVLYAEWRGTHGDRSTSAQALGVRESATVRTFYHPEIHAALESAEVVVVKNNDQATLRGGAPDKNNANAYELWGGVDNVEEANQCMEFMVRRYEGK